jgi:TPR repeat protein
VNETGPKEIRPPIITSDRYLKAIAAYEMGDYAKAFRLQRPLANQGHVDARNNLGMMYAPGQGVQRDYINETSNLR